MTEDGIWIETVLGVINSPSFYPDFECLDYQDVLSPNFNEDPIKCSDIQNYDYLLNEATTQVIRKQSIVDDLKKGLDLYAQNETNESGNYLFIENSNSFDLDQLKKDTLKRKYQESEQSDDDSYQTDNSNDTMEPNSYEYNGSKRVRTNSQESKNSSYNKKQSNKEAAIRYRQKKLKEKEELFNTRLVLEKENTELKGKIDDIQTEINFVKNLLVEMFVKKNLFSNNA